jgi:hypothetical protein
MWSSAIPQTGTACLFRLPSACSGYRHNACSDPLTHAKQCNSTNRHCLPVQATICLFRLTSACSGYRHNACSDPLTYSCQLLLSWRTQTARLRRKSGVVTCEQLDQVSFCHRNLPLCSNVREYAVQSLRRKLAVSQHFLLIMFTIPICIIYSKWVSGTTRYLQNVCTVLRHNKVFTKCVHSTQAQQGIYKMCAQYPQG